MVYIVKVEQCGYLIQVKTHKMTHRHDSSNVIFANVSKFIMSFFGAKILTFYYIFFLSAKVIQS